MSFFLDIQLIYVFVLGIQIITTCNFAIIFFDEFVAIHCLVVVVHVNLKSKYLIHHACFLSICFNLFVCAYMKPRDIDPTLIYHLFFLMFCFNLLFVCNMLSIGPLSSSIFLEVLFQNMLHKLWSWNQFTNSTNQDVGIMYFLKDS